MNERVEICLATSHGGHLELLLALEQAYGDRAHAFLTAPAAQVDELIGAGHHVELVVNPDRSARRTALNAAQALRAVRRLRPRVVVSAGANVAGAFCLAAKLSGARLIYIETMARVHDGSATGRLLYRVADHFFVQWPELGAVYPHAEVCRPALLEGVGGAVAGDGEGTFVAVGSHGQQFDRLLELVDRAVGNGLLPEPVIAQGGSSAYVPQNFASRPKLTPAEVREAVGRSAVIVTHAGSGLIAQALQRGLRPLVLPRRRSLGEHVDDHQVRIVDKLAALGFVVSLERHRLEDALSMLVAPIPRADQLPGVALVDRLRQALDEGRQPLRR